MPGTAKSLPVLMYHYISRNPSKIAVDPALFGEHCRTLAENGWRGVSLAEAEDFWINGRPLPKRSALFTFDDGYLDNFVYAMPILKKYGHCGVMFAVTDRLEKDGTPRADCCLLAKGEYQNTPLVDEVIRKDSRGNQQRLDVFCNHQEARFMDKDGTMAVAAHSKGHLSVFAGPEYDGFIAPGPQMRTFYMTAHERPFGLPAFRQTAGLSCRAFLPSPEMVEEIKRLVPQDLDGAYDFFASPANVRELEKLVGGHKNALGRFESDEEMSARFEAEIGQGKKDLERILEREVATLCWPWGKYSEQALETGKRAGFKAFVTTKEGVNLPGEPSAVRRFTAKPKSGKWLLSRTKIYSRPLLGRLYAALRT